uniref:Short-chain dehydrogenase/reductase n=1 Tax=Spironucleus salmonicida TaxID=348837 RepID=V6LX23_9EUKA|eukprot:EST48782.1 Short-chain dehydrogenase/reductase [Spironucleus salmonicida]
MQYKAALLALALLAFTTFALSAYNTVSYRSAPGAKPLAVISGGTGGIGLELIKILQNSFKIILLTRSTSVLPEWVESNADVYAMQIDYSDTATFQGHFEAFLRQHDLRASEIQHYHSLHGCGHYRRFSDFSGAQVAEFLAQNLTSHILLSHYFLQLPSLTNYTITSSLCASFPPRFFSLYAASKAAIQTFGTAVLMERKDLRVCVAVPVGVRGTRFMAQPQMQAANKKVQLSMLPPLSVSNKQVARALASKQGVVKVGWLNHASGLLQALIGVNAYLKLVGMFDLEPGKNE